MHGLVNRALGYFTRDTYGEAAWGAVLWHAKLADFNFDNLSNQKPGVTDQLVRAISEVLDRPRESLLEDMGNYLVSHPNCQPLRRLLRFGGAGFIDFLFSLDELPDRTRLALPDFHLPDFHLYEIGDDRFTLTVDGRLCGIGHLLVGLLRALADDYGALATIEHEGRVAAGESVLITVHEHGFAKGQKFDLTPEGATG